MVIVPKEEASRLISEIYRRPILWDRKHASFHNRSLADSVWMEVSQIMNHPKKILKIKWKSLRDTFRGELRKQAFYEKTNISRSMWIHYNSMKFLAEQMVPRQPAWERSSTRRYRGRAWIAGSNDFIDGNSPSPSGQQSPNNDIASPSNCADSPDLVECSEMEANDCEDSTEPPQLHFEACDVLDVVDMLSAGLMNSNDNDPIEIDASSSSSATSTAQVRQESHHSQNHRLRNHNHQQEQEKEKNEQSREEREEQQLLIEQQSKQGEQQQQHQEMHQQKEHEEQQRILQQQQLQEEQQLLLQQQEEHENQLLLIQQQKAQDHQRQQVACIMKEEDQVVDGYGVINLHSVEGKSRANVPIIQRALPEKGPVEGARTPCGHTVDSQDTENRFDDNYYFFMSLLPHIRTLPADRRMLLRMQMQNLVYEEVYKKNAASLQIINVVSIDERTNSSTVSSSSNLERHKTIESVSLSGVNRRQ